MITAIDVNERKKYILKNDKNTENPTIFILKPLTVSELLSVSSPAIDTDGVNKQKAVTTLIPTILAGLVEIQNISVSGKSANITAITKDTIDMLSVDVITELYEEIMSANKISEEEEKN